MDRLRADGRLRQIWGVLVPRESLLDPDTRAAAALLVAGPTAALTGLTAAALQGCPAAATPAVHVAVPYSSSLRTKEGLVVHQGRGLLNEVIVVRELRTVALEVAITEHRFGEARSRCRRPSSRTVRRAREVGVSWADR